MNSDASAKLWDEHINRRLFDLIHSNNSTDKLGGILAIGTLPPVNFPDAWNGSSHGQLSLRLEQIISWM
jgi:hypothetical protein